MHKIITGNTLYTLSTYMHMQWLKYAGSRRIWDPGPQKISKMGSGAPNQAKDPPDP